MIRGTNYKRGARFTRKMCEKDKEPYDQTKRKTDDRYFNNRRREREKRERNPRQQRKTSSTGIRAPLGPARASPRRRRRPSHPALRSRANNKHAWGITHAAGTNGRHPHSARRGAQTGYTFAKDQRANRTRATTSGRQTSRQAPFGGQEKPAHFDAASTARAAPRRCELTSSMRQAQQTTHGRTTRTCRQE